MKCCQCSNLAIIRYEFGPLCLDCHLKFQQALNIQISHQERMINFLLDEVDAISGVKLGWGRFPERKSQIVHTGRINMKPIILNNSVVGNINTGIVNSLNANLQNITSINQKHAQKIKDFVETVALDDKLNEKQKEEIIEKIDFLAQQLQLESQKKNKSTIKTIVKSITEVINTSASLITLWQTLIPIFLH